MEAHSEDSDTEQDISSEVSKDKLDMNEEYFFGKAKESKWRKNPVRRQIRKQLQHILCQLALVRPNAKKAKIKLNCFITKDILELILLYTNKYIDFILASFHKKEMLNEYVFYISLFNNL